MIIAKSNFLMIKSIFFRKKYIQNCSYQYAFVPERFGSVKRLHLHLRKQKWVCSSEYGRICESCWLASDFFESSLYFLNFVLAVSTSRNSDPPGWGYGLVLPCYPDTVVYFETTLFMCYHFKCFWLNVRHFNDRIFFC